MVNVRDLADQHLFAEWREIKMIVPSARRSLTTIPVADITKRISKQYTLNTGHVTFFYNKLQFLLDRYGELTDELLQRGYDIAISDFDNSEYQKIFATIPQIKLTPSSSEIQVSVDRISERLNQRPDWYRYYGDVYAPDFFIDRYNQYFAVAQQEC